MRTGSKQVGMNKEFEVLRAHLQTAEVKSEASCAELLTVQGLHRQVTERCATLETQVRNYEREPFQDRTLVFCPVENFATDI